MSSNNHISIQGVSKRYFKQGQRTLKEMLHDLFVRQEKPGTFLWALRSINFVVEEGTTYGVIGPNGSGKSTLLKLIAGVTEPTHGKVEVRGRTAPLIELGAGFHPELTGRENIFLNGAILGMKRDEIDSKLDQIISFAELGEFIDSPVKHYSSGMYLRLAFAVAIHVEADIILIDEILAVGDEKFQEKCLAKLEQLKVEGKSIIYVSHNIHSVLDFCDRVLYLKKGKIVMDDVVEKTVRKYSKDMESLA